MQILEYEAILSDIEQLEYEEAKTNREQAIIHLQDFKPLNNAHPKSAQYKNNHSLINAIIKTKKV